MLVHVCVCVCVLVHLCVCVLVHVCVCAFGGRGLQVAFLVSEACQESGALFEVGAGLFTKLRSVGPRYTPHTQGIPCVEERDCVCESE
jgi:hypothetical protein